MTKDPISKIVVVGGGITAVTAAATLKHSIPSLEVHLINTPPAGDALADQMISTLPSISTFHHTIGIPDTDAITGAGSGIRLGTLVEGFAPSEPEFVHTYDGCGVPLNGVPFHQLWLRDRTARELPAFDRFSRAAQIARTGRQSKAPFDVVEFGLQLTVERYGEMMRAYARHRGVHLHNSAIGDVVLRPDDGFIERILLPSGDTVGGDLFLDCTGPAGLLHQHMSPVFVDWSAWLPCDRLRWAEADPDTAVELMDRVTATPFGWTWKASSPRKASVGVVFSSAHAHPSAIAEEVGDAPEFVLNQGRKEKFWIRNCVAIGDAAVTIEPLHWPNLHLVHRQLERLVALMPGRDCAAVELALFNRETAAEADRIRDFTCLHYACSSRPEEFWKAAATVEPPSSLEHTLSLFRERGLLPFYAGDTFSRDSWLSVLLCLGIRPRRFDPLTDLVSADEAASAFRSILQTVNSPTLERRLPLAAVKPNGFR